MSIVWEGKSPISFTKTISVLRGGGKIESRPLYLLLISTYRIPVLQKNTGSGFVFVFIFIVHILVGAFPP